MGDRDLKEGPDLDISMLKAFFQAYGPKPHNTHAIYIFIYVHVYIYICIDKAIDIDTDMDIDNFSSNPCQYLYEYRFSIPTHPYELLVDSSAIFTVDIGFYIGFRLWPLLCRVLL